jgi:alpha-tubulin suppressor-like RCC1 family protein
MAVVFRSSKRPYPTDPKLFSVSIRVQDVKWLTALGVAVLIAGCEAPLAPRAGIPTLDDTGNDDFVAVSAGREHTCALTSDGTAYCWGSNEFGQLGVPDDGTTCPREDRRIACQRQPLPVSGALRFQRISAGGAHTCGLALDNSVHCWGDNLRGALGDPTVRQSFTPIPVASTAQFVDLAAGGFHTCALRADGTLFCWGANDMGQLGINTLGIGSGVPVAAQTSLRFASVATGDRRTCARLSDGITYCWGAMWVERRGSSEILRPQAQPFRIPSSPTFRALTVGASTTCGITSDNLAYCWEANPAGGMGDGTSTGSTTPIAVNTATGFVAISSGALHTCAIADTGHAYCWGGGALGQLGVSSSTLSGRCGAEAAIPCSRRPVRVSGWRVYSHISAGLANHVCALTLSRNIYCWGAGGMGQRGDGRVTVGEWSPAKTRSP